MAGIAELLSFQVSVYKAGLNLKAAPYKFEGSLPETLCSEHAVFIPWSSSSSSEDMISKPKANTSLLASSDLY